jgi:hypothetical protein
MFLFCSATLLAEIKEGVITHVHSRHWRALKRTLSARPAWACFKRCLFIGNASFTVTAAEAAIVFIFCYIVNFPNPIELNQSDFGKTRLHLSCGETKR